MRLEEQLYETKDLENLSSSVLYSFQSRPLPSLPSRPIREPERISPRSFPTFSGYTSNPLEGIMRYNQEQERVREDMRAEMAKKAMEKLVEDIKQRAEESDRMLRESILHKNFDGSSWGKSFGSSTDYVKEIPQGSLHIHAPLGFITGAKLFNEEGEEKLSNYEACMLDLQNGLIKRDNKKW